MSKSVEVDVDGRRLKLTNLEKVFYPETRFTKGQVIDYYTRIAPVVLAHLRDRPLTMKRYPDGVGEEFFYEKQAPAHAPDWITTARIASGTSRPFIDFILANDRATLVWLANMADLELHTSLSKADEIERPTMIAFDLDPGAPAGLIAAGRVALMLKETLAELGLECFPKTSGSKGVQVYVPLNVEGVSYDQTKPFAHALARLLEKRNPEQVVSKMQKSLRKGKVLIDWSQNDRHKTTVCVYSLRARDRPTVSTPVDWKELSDAVETDDPGSLAFDSEQVLARVAEHGDLFEPVLRLEQALPELAPV